MKDFWGIIMALIIVAAVYVIASNGFQIGYVVSSTASGFNSMLKTATGQVGHEGVVYA